MCLASKDLLQRCLRCATRNAEFFYGLVWSYCVELIQWHACSLRYCNSIIACAKAIQDVQLEDMGCSVGEYNINALELEDKMCIRKSEKRIEILHENKESSRGRSEKRRRKGREEQDVGEEGTTYKAGAFSTTFSKYSFG